MRVIEVIQGSYRRFSLPLLIDGVAFPVDTGYTVTAQLSHETTFIGALGTPVTLDSAEPGADWANGILMLVLDETATDLPANKRYRIEIQIDTGTKIYKFLSRNLISIVKTSFA